MKILCWLGLHSRILWSAWDTGCRWLLFKTCRHCSDIWLERTTTGFQCNRIRILSSLLGSHSLEDAARARDAARRITGKFS